MDMATGIEEYCSEFFQDIVSRASSEQVFKEEALFEIISDTLVDEGELEDTPVYAHFRPASGGMRVDGYCGDPLESTIAREANAGTLGLIVLDLNPGPELKTITQSEIGPICKRALSFINKSRDFNFRLNLEETSAGYSLAELIDKRWSVISKIKVYVFTNRTLSSRVKSVESAEIDGKPVVFDVWDLSRLYRLVLSGREREPLKVEFDTLPGGAMRALKAGSGHSIGDVYLAAIPGLDLARIYDRWQNRLLEQNVRVFLQARSNVNKGIKATLENEPEMFFSYNNGLTATAEHAETEETEDGLMIKSLDNLQIVNGGQTTASVYAAFKRGVDLSKVFVQMKINVISPEKAEDLVPQISRSANSQNKVSDADFFSNHPYHIRIEEISRRLFAPAAEGMLNQTKWFYERARGQYRDAQAHLTPSEKRKFTSIFPKSQCFTKTDLAKYLMVWTDKPYIANRGAQKNFAEFAKLIGTSWSKDSAQFSDYYFRQAIAKKIVFGATERIVTQREWYESGGYRSQHVVYAIGFLAHAVEAMGKSVDFEKIWANQGISDAFSEALGIAADCAHEVIMNPQEGSHNFSEWAKQINCWTTLREKKVAWNKEWLDELVSKSNDRDARAEAKRDRKEIDGIQAQEQVVQLGEEFWRNVLRWASREKELTDKDETIVKSATRISRGIIPQDWQCIELLKLMKRLEAAGCPYKMKKGAGRTGRLRRS